jgi:hypothetical protein
MSEGNLSAPTLRCENCKHWERDPQLVATTGKCKLYPPQMVIFTSQTNQTNHTTQFRSRAEWPVMGRNKVCGQHSPRIVLAS